MRVNLIFLILVIVALVGCSNSNTTLSSPSQTFLHFQEAVENEDLNRLDSISSIKNPENFLADKVSISADAFAPSNDPIIRIWDPQAKKSLQNTKVVKEHIYGDIAELEVEITFTQQGEEYQFTDMYSIPLVLEDGEWKFYGLTHKECNEKEQCYWNDDSCFNKKWMSVHNFELLTKNPNYPNIVCSCKENECTMHDISVKTCSNDNECYYHVGYDSCFNEANFKRNRWELLTENPDNPDISCTCQNDQCIRIDKSTI